MATVSIEIGDPFTTETPDGDEERVTVAALVDDEQVAEYEFDARAIESVILEEVTRRLKDAGTIPRYEGA